MVSKNTDRGFVIIAIICILAILSITSALIFYHQQSSTRIVSQAIHHERADLQAVSQEFHKADSLQADKFGLACGLSSASAGSSTTERRLCIMRGAPVVFDFDRYFLNSILPSGSSVHAGSVTKYNFRLTPGSIRSAYSSSYAALLPLLPRIIVKTNFECQEIIDLSAVGGPVLAASLGYVDLQGQLIINRDTTIISGGDMHLSAITSPAAGADLKLVSATGVISIDSISNGINLFASAPIGIYLPANAKLSGKPEMARLTFLPLGFQN